MNESPFSLSERVEGRPTTPFSAIKEVEKRGLELLHVRKMRNHPFSEREEGGTSPPFCKKGGIEEEASHAYKRERGVSVPSLQERRCGLRERS